RIGSWEISGLTGTAPPLPARIDRDILCDQPRIEAVVLGQHAAGAGELTKLARVDTSHRQPRRLSKRRQMRLEADIRLLHKRLAEMDWSTKLIRGLTSEAAAGFQSRRGLNHDDSAPVTPHNAPFPTYKAARVHHSARRRGGVQCPAIDRGLNSMCSAVEQAQT